MYLVYLALTPRSFARSCLLWSDKWEYLLRHFKNTAEALLDMITDVPCSFQCETMPRTHCSSGVCSELIIGADLL